VRQPIFPQSDALLCLSQINTIVLEVLLKDPKAEIISKRRAKTIVAVGKRLGLAGFVVAAKIPGHQRVPDVHDMHADASPLLRTHCSAPMSSVLPSPLFCRVGWVAKDTTRRR
jgi:hypothetical protein